LSDAARVVTAFHEAGHAFFAAVCDLLDDYVSIGPFAPSQAHGETKIRTASDDELPVTIDVRVLAAAAGVEAEKRKIQLLRTDQDYGAFLNALAESQGMDLADPNRRFTSDDGDRERVRNDLKRLDREGEAAALYSGAQAKAAERLKDPAVWDCVSEIADALLADEKVKQEKVHAILRRHGFTVGQDCP